MTTGWGNILPWKNLLGSAIGTAGQVAGAGLGGYWLGSQAMKKLRPEDYFYNPTPENLANQFGFAQTTPYAQSILAQQPEQVDWLKQMQQAGGAQFMPPSPQAQAQQAIGQVGGGTTAPVARWGTVREGGWDYMVGYDAKGNIISREPLGRTELAAGAQTPMSQYQQQQMELAQQEAQRAQEQQTWQRQWAQQQAEMERQAQEQQWEYQQEQLEAEERWRQAQQEEAERQYKAQLASQPISWLQYASYTGEQPVVQPWMLPLSQSQYGWNVGEQIPGWSAESGAQMPELMRPSAQMWARMGPTSQQQFLGYKQARTGATPEEAQWRLQAMSPPGGGNRGLSWAR